MPFSVPTISGTITRSEEARYEVNANVLTRGSLMSEDGVGTRIMSSCEKPA